MIQRTKFVHMMLRRVLVLHPEFKPEMSFLKRLN